MTLSFWTLLFALLKLIGLSIICIVVVWAICECVYEYYVKKQDEKEFEEND